MKGKYVGNTRRLRVCLRTRRVSIEFQSGPPLPPGIQDIPERRREFLATTRNKIDLHT